MQFESNFKCLSFDPFSLQENFMNNECDPDLNFYQNNVSNVKAIYFLMTEVKISLTKFDPNPFSVVQLNIRSMKKNFENFKDFLTHGVNHKRNHRTRIIFYEAIIFLLVQAISQKRRCASFCERMVLLQN